MTTGFCALHDDGIDTGIGRRDRIVWSTTLGNHKHATAMGVLHKGLRIAPEQDQHRYACVVTGFDVTAVGHGQDDVGAEGARGQFAGLGDPLRDQGGGRAAGA